VRLVSATNADINAEVAAGRFREDLLFRLNTIEIHLPPLRDRREDIPPLAAHFLRAYAARYGKAVREFDHEAMESLGRHSWPGNVRELDHAVERAVLLARGERVAAGDLGLRAREGGERLESMSLDEVESFLIRKALARHDSNVSHAAKSLGLSRSALYRRMERHGL
jgi:DNA-binding NtrC family response regulator